MIAPSVNVREPVLADGDDPDPAPPDPGEVDALVPDLDEQAASVDASTNAVRLAITIRFI